MTSRFPANEAAMYPVIKAYFLDSLKFAEAYADGDETYLRLPKNSKIRKVDVVALQNLNDRVPRVNLVEAKLIARGHDFDACVNQLDSIRDSGDWLWAAFSERDWESLSDSDRRRNEKKLSDHGCGLLLVSQESCYPKIKAPQNADATSDGRSEVLKQLGFSKDIFIPNVRTLGVAEARNAGGIMALTSLIAEILYELEHRKANFQKYWDSEQDTNFVEHGWFVPSIDFSGKVGCELDPFGRLLEDGFPTAWVEIELSLESVSGTLDRGSSFGTHVYLDDGGWKWKTISIADGTSTIKYWADRGLDQTVKLMQRIEILGRVRESLKSDFERAIKEARKCLTDPLK